jgi:hypothetical protein
MKIIHLWFYQIIKFIAKRSSSSLNIIYYKFKALNNMAQKLNGKIICPITNEEFNLSEAIRVYLS